MLYFYVLKLVIHFISNSNPQKLIYFIIDNNGRLKLLIFLTTHHINLFTPRKINHWPVASNSIRSDFKTY